MTEGSITHNNTLHKSERICSMSIIDRLFKGGQSRSMSAYPIRVVYTEIDSDDTDTPCQILVSVPKKCFKRAVKRNRVKRQLRESYRRNKDIVISKLAHSEGKNLVMAFIWLDNNLHDSIEIEAKMKNLLHRISEKL